nr:ubiquinol-cytochrome C chaperone family protein [uncultured Sphingomonas sp.]
MRSLMAMLRPKGADAEALYGAVVAEARQPGWYIDGAVPDDVDGRFAVLSTLCALTIIRLEDGGEDAARHAVALTERFIADMDAQLREAGFGDPSVGKQVRLMVGSLANRVDRWRAAKDETSPWDEVVAFSVHRSESVSEAAATYAAEACRRFDEGITGRDDRAVIGGRIG